MTNLEQKMIIALLCVNEAVPVQYFERMMTKEEVDTTIHALMEKKIIHRSHHGNGKYQLTANASIEGNVVALDENYVIVAPSGDHNIFVPRSPYEHIRIGDTVLVNAIYHFDGKCLGKIQKRVIHHKKNLVGIPIQIENDYYVNYKGTLYKINMTRKKDDILKKVIRYKLVKKKRYQSTYAELIKVIGSPTDKGIQNSIVLNRLGIHDHFPKAVQLEVKSFPDKVTKRDLFGRVDCRDHLVVTIDDADTKDMDDAIEVTKTEDGYRLIVHIADVAHYVKYGSKLWKEVFYRGTSIYCSDRVEPMLPEELSNHLCSLKEGVDRLAMSCELWFDKKGNVVKRDIYESVIRSEKKMSYQAVNQVFQGNIPDDYLPFVSNLSVMKELSDLIRGKMLREGYLNFNIPETRITAGKEVEPNICLRTRSIAEDMIENFMIIANEEVAKYFVEKNALAIYRILERPKMQKVLKILRELELSGYRMNLEVPENITPHFIQSLLNDIHTTKDKIVQETLVHVMNRAEYSLEEMMHFGIGSIYTHFTSPIRRINDLCIHMLLKQHIKQWEFSEYDDEELREILLNVATQATKTERIANVVEQTDKKLCEVEYMLHHKEEEFNAQIINMNGHRMIVQLEDSLIEGNVFYKDVNQEWKYFDQKKTLVRKDGTELKVGDYIRVVLSPDCYGLSTVDLAMHPINGNIKLLNFSIIGVGKMEKETKKFLCKKNCQNA